MTRANLGKLLEEHCCAEQEKMNHNLYVSVSSRPIALHFKVVYYLFSSLNSTFYISPGQDLMVFFIQWDTV